MQGMISKYGLPYLAVCHVTFKLGKTKNVCCFYLKYSIGPMEKCRCNQSLEKFE